MLVHVSFVPATQGDLKDFPGIKIPNDRGATCPLVYLKCQVRTRNVKNLKDTLIVRGIRRYESRNRELVAAANINNRQDRLEGRILVGSG